MINQNNGGPAFPVTGVFCEGMGMVEPKDGMTLRDYFAAKAMDGFNKKMIDYGWSDEILDEHARMSYRIADAMLAAMEQQS